MKNKNMEEIGEDGEGLRGFVRSKRWGNITMWISLLIGQPLLEIMYFRDWFVKIGGGSDYTKSFFCTSWS